MLRLILGINESCRAEAEIANKGFKFVAGK